MIRCPAAERILRLQAAHAKARAAAKTSFGFMLKPFDRFAPQRVIVVAVHKRNAEFAAVLLAFVFASQILLCRENVGVEVKNRRCVSVLRQPFKNGA